MSVPSLKVPNFPPTFQRSAPSLRGESRLGNFALPSELSNLAPSLEQGHRRRFGKGWIEGRRLFLLLPAVGIWKRGRAEMGFKERKRERERKDAFRLSLSRFWNFKSPPSVLGRVQFLRSFHQDNFRFLVWGRKRSLPNSQRRGKKSKFFVWLRAF